MVRDGPVTLDEQPGGNPVKAAWKKIVSPLNSVVCFVLGVIVTVLAGYSTYLDIGRGNRDANGLPLDVMKNRAMHEILSNRIPDDGIFWVAGPYKSAFPPKPYECGGLWKSTEDKEFVLGELISVKKEESLVIFRGFVTDDTMQTANNDSSAGIRAAVEKWAKSQASAAIWKVPKGCVDEFWIQRVAGGVMLHLETKSDEKTNYRGGEIGLYISPGQKKIVDDVKAKINEFAGRDVERKAEQQVSRWMGPKDSGLMDHRNAFGLGARERNAIRNPPPSARQQIMPNARRAC
nr:hypothetical protein [Candidatus Burarchaeum sp.]